MKGGQAFRVSARRAHWLPPRWAERPRAYTGPFPITSARTLAAVDRDEADIKQNSSPLTPLPVAVEQPAADVPPPPVAVKTKKAQPRIKSGVTVKDDETPGRALSPTASCSGDGLAPEGTSGGPAGASGFTPANASQCMTPALPEVACEPPVVRAPIPKAERLALPLNSEMERLFAEVMARPVMPLDQADETIMAKTPITAPKVWCERCDARVPGWFGDDCISGACSLRGGKPKVRA